MAPKPDWTNDDRRRLEELWATGLSAEKIGRQIGRSKNSVIGQAHRMRLPARAAVVVRKTEPLDEAKTKLARTLWHDRKDLSIPDIARLLGVTDALASAWVRQVVSDCKHKDDRRTGRRCDTVHDGAGVLGHRVQAQAAARVLLSALGAPRAADASVLRWHGGRRSGVLRNTRRHRIHNPRGPSAA